MHQLIIEQAELELLNLEELFAKSGLPKDCDKHFENGLLLKVRHL